ncbi:MAG: DNA mismatch repair protein MutS [Acidobacteria bacterium]|nr:DNA mismatch repair protein MutS [Acidobacteriota bacterium]
MSATAGQPPAAAAPAAEYRARLDRLHDRIRTLDRSDRRLGNARLVVVLAGIGGALVVRSVAAAWLGVAAAVFVGLVVRHARVVRGREADRRRAAFHERGLARLEDRWTGQGEMGERFRDTAHPYAEDLDLFGRGSLFELLCTARTAPGEQTLAAWLKWPADPDEVRARHEALAELRDRLDLRERLALAGEDVRAGVDADALRSWAAAPRVDFPAWSRPMATFLALVNLVAIGAWAAGFGLWPVAGAFLASAILARVLRVRVRAALKAVEQPLHDLPLLADVLALVEREPFRAARLRSIKAALEAQGMPPSRRIRQLAFRSDLADARRNQLFAPFGALVLWGVQCAIALENWRRTAGPAVPRWLDAVGEFEALSALASHSWERPEDTFPDLVAGGPLFEAEGIGHPLIPGAACVRNDVSLGGAAPGVLIVSGSNMSGKSTLLRTVGVNAVLAFAGAPVRAARLRLSPLAVGAVIRVQDSLAEGTSRFYAEILHLKALVERAGAGTPVLFLLDEILHGTNSHDRRIGAAAIIRALVTRGAIGLVTTHDLALAEIANELAPRAANVHFEDRLDGDRIVFDYRMRPGVVTRSNAIALMRAVGLSVDG